MQETTKIQL